MIDLRGNPRINRIPLSFGHLDPNITRSIIFDPAETYSWLPDQPTHLLTDTRVLILYCKAKLSMNQSPDLVQIVTACYKSSSKILNFKPHPHLDDKLLRQIVPPLECKQILLSSNHYIRHIPSSFGFLNPDITQRIVFDQDHLMPSAIPHIHSAGAIVAFAWGLLHGSLLKLNQVKLIVVGNVAVARSSLIRAMYGDKFDGSIRSTDGIDLGV